MTQNNTDHRRQEVQRIVKNACDQLNAEGVDARNYVEQLAWLFFLKAFDETETRKEQEAAFDDTPYERRLTGSYAWSHWAKDTDHPDEMLEFVDGKLWIKLTSPDAAKGLGNDVLAQRFRRIFDNVRNYSRRGVSFAKVVQQVDKLHFSSETDVIVLSEIYEDLLKRVAADSAGYAGEFYTQRHIIRTMVQVVQPQPGERVYDPCFGTAGFLGEAADYLRHHSTLSGNQLDELQHKTFLGMELKPLTYLLGSMNMILHGIEGANLELANTLEVHSQNVAENDKYQIILANPPYGGKMAQELQTNFRVRSSATECLFLQHIMANLAKGGRAAVVIPEGVLFRGGPDQKVRKELLEQFKVHTILSLPAGCFFPYTGVKTNVIFFDRAQDGTGTESVWFYDLTNDGFELKQTRKPIAGNQLPDFLAKWQGRIEGDNSWTMSLADIVAKGYDLSAKNPNKVDDYEHRPALELVQSIKAKEARITELLDELETLLLAESLVEVQLAGLDGEDVCMADVCEITSRLIDPREPQFRTCLHVGGANIESKTGRLIDLKTAAEENLKSSKFFFDESVVLYNKIRPYLMKVARPDFSGVCSADMYPLTPKAGKATRDFIYYELMSRRFTDYAISGSNRAGMPKVNREHLFAYRFKLPSLAVQQQICEHLDEAVEAVHSLGHEMAAANLESTQLREAILRKAFAGEL